MSLHHYLVTHKQSWSKHKKKKMTKAFDAANKEMRKLEAKEKKYKDKLSMMQPKIEKDHREHMELVRLAQSSAISDKLHSVQEEMKVVSKKIVAAELVARTAFQAAVAARVEMIKYKRRKQQAKYRTELTTYLGHHYHGSYLDGSQADVKMKVKIDQSKLDLYEKLLFEPSQKVKEEIVRSDYYVYWLTSKIAHGKLLSHRRVGTQVRWPHLLTDDVLASLCVTDWLN